MEQGLPTDPMPASTIPEPATSRLDMQDTEVGSVFVSNYPPFSQWSGEHIDAVHAALDTPVESNAEPLGLYLHIPFCRRRCKFCYFRVYTDKNASEVQAYTDALGTEIEIYAGLPAVRDRPIRFVYFGGGTPSYIAAKHLTDLVERARRALPWDQAEEVTFECEPGTLSQPKLEVIRNVGVTRLSLGVENFNDRILEINGRAHVSHEIGRVVPWIHELEFDQFNLDLIAGMIGETWETWRDSVQRTIETDPDSVTVYQLELPFNTRFSKQFFEGTLEIPPADWALKREWNLYAIEQLEAAGYVVSSAYTMVKGNRDCSFRYRDSLWQGADMLGTGVSSFGHVQGVHAQNTANWTSYLGALAEGRLPLERAYPTSPEERLTREMILQLKTGRIEPAYFRRKFGVDILDRYAGAFARLRSREMVRVDQDAVLLSRTGLLQVDSLLPEFYDPRFQNARYT